MLDARRHCTHTPRAAIPGGYALLRPISQWLGLILIIVVRKLDIERLHLVNLLGLFRFGPRGLEFVGLPGIRARRRVVIKRGLGHDEFRTAEPAEIALRVIELSAILTLCHNIRPVQEFNYESYQRKVLFSIICAKISRSTLAFVLNSLACRSTLARRDAAVPAIRSQ